MLSFLTFKFKYYITIKIFLGFSNNYIYIYIKKSIYIHLNKHFFLLSFIYLF